MLIISILIITILTTFGISSFVETEQQIKQTIVEDEMTDNSNFIMIRDENGKVHLIKMIGVLRFGDGSLKLEMGKAIYPIGKNDTIIIEDKTFFDYGP
jgi:hypothetical protein